ncbi:SRPBCC domain-containing protein [Kitasatospora sp. NA04385]|uniref:SRPBCC family protein n=1 Tax=Kitasatospora sp. NA04385 TaxID=2742135 RepID=UPI001591F092|nr:SRPBCC domain-containing protein [Kitasatospora sp. NA04385]QKW18148.1 SRPBCC domain-containing protein [Kitasatospora sp. NA04385]
MPHPFELEFELTLPADPEQVWEAIATGPGIDSWFMGRNEVDPRVGGTASMELGGRPETSTVTAYEPGKRFATRTEPGGDGRFMAFEYLVEGRDGGSTVLRVVHSGVLGDDWADEYDALRRGWPFHLHTLREYLTHFAGRTGAPVFAVQPTGGRPAAEVRATLTAALALPADPPTGTRVRADLAGLPPLEGELTWSDGERFEVRTADGLYSFLHPAGVLLLFHHLFAAPAPSAAEAETAWQHWLSALLAP